MAAATNRNQANRMTTRPGRQVAINPRYCYRQHQRVERLLRNVLPVENIQQQQENQQQENQQEEQETTQEDGDDAFGDAFPQARIANLSEAARVQHQQIQH